MELATVSLGKKDFVKPLCSAYEEIRGQKE